MHILVLGGTGPSGLAFIDAALAAGHQLTLYARNPSKFPQQLHENANVTIIKGEFTDIESVKKALSTGAEVLVSFAGPAIPHKGMAVTEFYERLFPLLPTESSIKRCMICATASYQLPEDKPGVKWFMGISGVKLLYGSAYSEINGMCRAAVAIPLDKIEWTIFRLPVLTNGKATAVKASYLGGGGDGMFVSRKSVANWVLTEIDEKTWVGKAPALSGQGWI